MHYNMTPSTPDGSYTSSKVYGVSQSQTSSPPWSERGSFDSPSSSRNTGVSAPRMHTVPLPQGAPSTPPRSNHYGLMTPPTSPQAIVPTLDSLLVYDPRGQIRCDVSLDATQIRLRPGVSLTCLDRQAMSPPTTRMIINIPGSNQSWSFEVTNPYGVTVRDVLSKLCDRMKRQVGHAELAAFSTSAREVATQSFQQRSNTAAYGQGLVRFDFLGSNRFFIGLTRARDGSCNWDACFARL